jgi:hypothetical protein
MAWAIPDRNYVDLTKFAFRRIRPGQSGFGQACVVTYFNPSKFIRFVTHNDVRVEELEYNVDDFYKVFEPDFRAGSSLEAAKELYAICRHLPVVPPAHERLLAIIHMPEENFKMKSTPSKKPAKKDPPKFQPVVVSDYNRHTAILYDRDDDVCRFIPLDVEGIDIAVKPVDEFDRLWSPLVDYPVERAAKLYAGYAANLGATEDALKILGTLTTLSTKEIEMATAKKVATAANKKAAAAKAAANSKTKSAPKAAKAAKAEKPAKSAAPKEKKETASAMFCELIMAGKLTDDQIFAQVQKKFGLSDDKRSYVKWYRNKLTKDGKKPPAAKQ